MKRFDIKTVVNSKAKLQWAKTFEKIKVVNTIGHQNSQRKNSVAPHTITRQPLAPYYPAAFTPGYLSLLCRDEHGRKAVSGLTLIGRGSCIINFDFIAAYIV